MRERAKALVGPRAAGQLVISTFHSLGVRLLREDGTALGLKQAFSILDSDDVLSLLRDAGATTKNGAARHRAGPQVPQGTFKGTRVVGHRSFRGAARLFALRHRYLNYRAEPETLKDDRIRGRHAGLGARAPKRRRAPPRVGWRPPRWSVATVGPVARATTTA